jgi:hypothetical protein
MKIAIYSHSIAPSIDGVCRRFTGILHEMEKQGHETILFTMEDEPEDLPASTRTVTLDHVIFPSYPNKKVAWPTARAFSAIMSTLKKEMPEVGSRICLLSTMLMLYLCVPCNAAPSTLPP